MKSSIPKTHFKPLQAQRHDIFSIPFWTMRWNGDLQQIAQDCRTAVRDIEHAKTHRVHAEENYGQTVETEYTTYFHRDIHDDIIVPTNWYKSLATNLKDTYVDIMHKCFVKDFREMGLKRSDIHLWLWVNRYTGEHSHASHNHKGSVISGTFYVKTTPPCAPIVFENPMESANFLFTAADRGHLNGQVVEIGVPAVTHEFKFHPEDGDIAFWPSYLYHQVPRQLNQEERISISFNLAHTEKLNYGIGDEVLEEMSYDFLYHEE